MDPLARLIIELPIVQVLGDAVFLGVEHALLDLGHLLVGKAPSSSFTIDPQHFADHPGESPADSLDLPQCERHLSPAVNVRVLNTEDQFEVVLIVYAEGFSLEGSDKDAEVSPSVNQIFLDISLS